MSELFRFVLKRPPQVVQDAITIAPRFSRQTFAQISNFFKSEEGPADPSSVYLEYGYQIGVLGENLPESLNQVHEVTNVVSKAFPNVDLSKLVEQEPWAADKNNLDLALVRIFVAASDPKSAGPGLTQQRQLYDLVEQVAQSQSSPHPSFSLKRLVLPLKNSLQTGPKPTQPPPPPSTAPPSSGEDPDIRKKALLTALNIVNARHILDYTDLDNSKFLVSVKPSWTALLPQISRDLLDKQFGSAPYTSLLTIHTWLVNAINAIPHDPEIAAAERSSPWDHSVLGPGINPIIGGHLIRDVGWLPAPTKSVIQPAGLGDLIIVRENVYKYERGEIGTIQNVLKSEKWVRETKRLDRTEEVDVVTQENQTEQERDSSNTERFALNRESANVIKSDSSLKTGLSVSAKYGPSVEVKADLASATSNSLENSTKLASQYSKDVTERATSKVVEKTFKSTSITTITQFQENFRHEFNNTNPSAGNISGVYQWVNKISQCQMYNYGARMFIDIIVPEPAAFLISSDGSATPPNKPTPLTESAADINETNYASIGARYFTTDLKAPPELFVSVSYSFKDSKSDGSPAEQQHSSSVTLDVVVPAGYLAYAAQVSVSGIARWITANETVTGPRTLTPLITLGGLKITGNSGIPVSLPLPFVTTALGLSVSLEDYATMSGTVRVSCIRDPSAFATWQVTTYTAIATAYNALKTDYDRTVAEAAVSSLTAVAGQNPLANKKLIQNELKKASIAMVTTQNFEVFGSIVNDTKTNYPQVNNFAKAESQGRYLQFLEQAFEWENMQYMLYPYYWARKSTWASRIALPTPPGDPDYADFIKSGAARVSVPARLGFKDEVLYFLLTGIPWKTGDTTTIVPPEFLSIADEIAAAEGREGKEHPQGKPWYNVVPTELVQLREDSKLPEFELDKKTHIWKEKVLAS